MPYVALSLELLNEVFQRQFTTISSIPPPCNPKNSSEERPDNRKKLQITAIHKALVDWREPNGCLTLISRLLELPKRQQPSKLKSKQLQDSATLDACRKKLSNGHYTAAIRVLSSNGVAPCTEVTISELSDKHPPAPPPTIPDDPIPCDAIKVDTVSVLKAIKSFPKGTSCGRDGLRAQHLFDAMSGAANTVADELLASMTNVVNLWLSGKCPSPLGKFIASAPLTPLQKPGGGVRPITVGTIWRRLVSKLVAIKVGKAMSMYLGDYQFGVGVPCGGESILHSVNRLMELIRHLHASH
ncbi:uncharacterized protein LOC113317402 [Papaver somniferum]|uniref:uncharacterized protein LOC113317402 n=1 Tax=Papaver somniferum TaxID=3469 RepID=UPI000E702A7B|nr:uncharacterized protein LOC113317402 [Papaver somniferum]XP_026421301.1 uncharacterized protein LOC113317402 [Papaver somniferum]XP_026421302.1 uncharacterized protein LOC113317402 [Papaver somniferum]